ncbi:MAG: ABC transporter ATP-binding protein [Alphaproteobacteria bacterium]|nr:ABC transporter ATP-binding protein [Alphaproteobacteria bacterium]
MKRYGDLAAVDGVSLDIPRGSFLTLLGPSGSGKTTILMSIAGFVRPTEGDILLDGARINDLPPEKRNFGMVFQGYALFPHMTVAENVWFPLRVRGQSFPESERAVMDVLQLVQLDHLKDRLPSELSGGQQQRVALARALVFKPDLLLLDEPLSALDKKLRADLQWELKDLHEKLGTTFIYVTHDQEEALSMSDEIVILRDGKIEQMGKPGDLYEKPATSFVADFLGKSNFIRARLIASTGPDQATYAVGEQEFNLRPAPATVGPGETVAIALRPEKIDISVTEPETTNRLKATIRQFNYHGTSFHLRVSAAPLGDLFVTVQAWRCGITPSINGELWISWEPEAGVVVRETVAIDDRPSPDGV